MNETIPGSSSVGHTTAEISREAEKDRMSAEVITEGGRDRVLIYNTVRTRGVLCKHASFNERELDEERGRALGREVDMDIPGVVRMRVFVPVRERIRNQADRSR